MNTFDFKFHNLTIRAVEIEGEPWFVAKDVCDVLAISNVSRALSRLHGTDKGITSVNTLGGAQRLLIVNESGLYKLVLKSKKPEAKEFQHWVTSVVLPAIRKDGGYIRGEELVNRARMIGDRLRPLRSPLVGVRGLPLAVPAETRKALLWSP